VVATASRPPRRSMRRTSPPGDGAGRSGKQVRCPQGFTVSVRTLWRTPFRKELDREGPRCGRGACGAERAVVSLGTRPGRRRTGVDLRAHEGSGDRGGAWTLRSYRQLVARTLLLPAFLVLAEARTMTGEGAVVHRAPWPRAAGLPRFQVCRRSFGYGRGRPDLHQHTPPRRGRTSLNGGERDYDRD